MPLEISSKQGCEKVHFRDSVTQHQLKNVQTGQSSNKGVTVPTLIGSSAAIFASLCEVQTQKDSTQNTSQ